LFHKGINVNFRLSRTTQLENYIKFDINNILYEVPVWDLNSIIVSGRSKYVCKRTRKYNWYKHIFFEQLDDLGRAIKEDAEPICNIDDALIGIGLLEDVYNLREIKAIPSTIPVPGEMI